MKKAFLILFFLMAMSPVFSKHISEHTARQVAQTFLNSKMGGSPEIHLIDFAEKTEFPNFYVFGNEHCFVIIAADDAVHPVLGYSTENAFITDGMPENAYGWLKAYNDVIAYAVERSIEADIEILSEWERLLNGRGLEPKSRNHVEPLVRTRWQYATPFNNLCPSDTAGPGGHAKAGCGAVAMAQLMNYWEHPVRGVGSYSYTPSNHPEYGALYANFGETVYDWDNMRNVYQKTYSDTEALAVATLIYHCGVSVRMNYGPDASATNISRIDDALIAYFNYNISMSLEEKSHYTDNQWTAMLKNDLNAERPIIYRGQNEENTVGHIFICDGYDEYDCFHFNWGYMGRWDGYYAIGSLYGGTNYSYVNKAIFGIYPNATSINPPTNVATSVNGRNVVVTWNSVSNASSYKVYRDGDLIANNITGTSFTNTNVPYGVHNFYVKSVKSDGTMSLKSNSAVADVHFSGPLPTNLQASVSGQNVNLSWNAPQPESAILQYGTGDYVAGANGGGNGLYWAHRYSSTIMSDYAGMAVQKVAFYFKKPGTYTISIYKGDEANPRELVQQQQYQASSTEGWQDVVFSSPVPIDYTQDLWVVFYADASITHPASFCEFSGSGVVDASLYSSAAGGTIWKEYLYNGNTTSWLMKTYITDGTYTYNLYRNGTVVANNLTGNTYTDANLPDGFYDYHVTTNYFGGASDPSNTVHVMVGNPTYTITTTANPTIGGMITGNGTYIYNQTCTVTATPNLGYNFVNWTEDGSVVSEDTIYSFTVTDNRNLVANFQLQNFTIAVSASPSDGGSVTGGGGYNYGDTCTLTATANTGYTFQRWTLQNGTEVSADSSYSFTVTESASYIAHFQINSYTITVSADPENGGIVTGGGTYNYGSTCTVMATPNTGYDFINWTENDSVVSEEANYFFTVTGNRNLVALFTRETYEITAEVDPKDAGVITGTGSYQYGDTATLSVTPSENYIFLNWVENGTNLSDSTTVQVIVTEPHHLMANLYYFDGIGENAALVEVFPNPAKDILTIKGEGIRRVTVINMMGQIVEDQLANGQELIQIDVHSYPSATYFLRIQIRDWVIAKRIFH
ncbi:MAG: C10 family peptidase [Bacteroidales bacterium]|nr:C10 family peptidase [Bacteroidales bacterium]